MRFVNLLIALTLLWAEAGFSSPLLGWCAGPLAGLKRERDAELLQDEPIIEFDGRRYVLHDPDAAFPIPITDGQMYPAEVVFNHLGIDSRTINQMSGKRVISVGEGMGSLLPALLEKSRELPAPINLTGYDTWYDSASVEGKPPLKEYFERYREHLRSGSAYELPEASGSVDFVLSHAVFWHLGRPTDALNEVMRVLVPGGQFHVGPLREEDMMTLVNHAKGMRPKGGAVVEFLQDSRAGALYKVIFEKSKSGVQ